MNTGKLAAVVLVMLAVVAVGLVVLFTSSSKTATDSTFPLAPVEVRSYLGKDLSSVNDFRENSIAGPQHIDISVTG